jgi:hypothetical protein
MCDIEGSTGTLLAIVTTPPLALQFMLLVGLCWSTLARSRTTSEPLLVAFVRDGALTFLVRRTPALRTR